MKTLMLALALGLLATPVLAQYDPYGYGSNLNGISRSVQRQQREQGYVDDITGAIRSQNGPLQSNVPFQGQPSSGYGTYGTYNGGQPCYNRCR